MKTPQFVSLGHIVDNLDHLRIPLNATERATRKGDFPYWGANNIVDYIDDYTINEPVVLIGEDGAPFLETGRNVAFSVNGPIWPNNHIHVMRPLEGHSPDYIAYALNTVDYSLYVTGSTRLKLTRSSLDRIRIPYYDLPTQRRIADYLDRETAQIDAMAEALDGLVARLEERRAATIEIPFAELNFIRAPFGTIVRRMKIGSAAVGDQEPAAADEKGILKTSAVSTGRFIASENRVVTSSTHVLHTNVSENTLIVNRLNSPQFVGAACVPDKSYKNLFLSDKLWELTLWADPEFVSYWTKTREYRRLVTEDTVGTSSSMLSLSYSRFCRFRVPLPPLDEQRRIADHLDAETAKIDAMIAKAGELRALLEERRSALITATVTGLHPVPEEP